MNGDSVAEEQHLNLLLLKNESNFFFQSQTFGRQGKAAGTLIHCQIKLDQNLLVFDDYCGKKKDHCVR
jgi:hypothetical protein